LFTRKDLQHPNEFIKGSTLRFLCKLKEPELLEPLMPAIRACLEYKHSYVRRNAVMAIFTIYKNFNFLMPDAPEIIANFLGEFYGHLILENYDKLRKIRGFIFEFLCDFL
jgi:vesicle coat complex subunit